MTDKYTVGMDCTVKETIEKMTANMIKAVVVVDKEGIVKGLFSNGDMRAYFLKGGSLSSSILEAMNPDPVLFNSRMEVEEEQKTRFRVIYPIVNDRKMLIDVIDSFETTFGSVVYKSDVLHDIP